MTASQPFLPPRSTRQPAHSDAFDSKSTSKHLLQPPPTPQVRTKLADAPGGKTLPASPGVARVEKLKNECEELLTQLDGADPDHLYVIS
ncbi:hypothetical protein JCM3774_005280 [Rhodotorula dairenensis]